jgi:Ca2+-binding RTX toxin-like protein
MGLRNMRSLLLALVALALLASPASAAVIEIEDHFCGCDPSSGDVDTRGLVVRAVPGEVNRMSIRSSPRGVVIDDLGAALTGACRLATSGGRFCRGQFDGVEVELGDGSDRIDFRDLGGSVDGGPGDDEIVVTGPPHLLVGGPGADLLDARLAPGSAISYAGHTEGVTVSVNGLADDGAAGEGDNVLGPLGSIQGGSGDDTLVAGPDSTGLTGGAGNDTLVGSPEGESLLGQEGDDDITAGDGTDHLEGGPGADRLSGGPGRDEASYADHVEGVRVSIGDGPNDGVNGEGDDVLEDVEDLTGGRGWDLLYGDDDGNRLIAYGGQDVLNGGAGPDRLIGWDDGDRLDAGSGRDSVEVGALDHALLADGEADRTDCNSSAPVIASDTLDTFRRCAPLPRFRPLGRLRRGRPVRLTLRCPPPTAVPCTGHFFIRAVRGHRRLSRRVRFGPIRAGGRVVLSVRPLVLLSRDSLIQAVGVSVRDDNVYSVTPWLAGF